MEKNFIFLLIIYLFYTYSQKNFNIKDKHSFTSNQKIDKIEVFKINKNTKKILLNMINCIHSIFIKEKIIYYIVDDILYGYKQNKKFNKYSDSINIHVIEETFDFEVIYQILKNTKFKIINNFGLYKIISKDVNLLNRNSICINIFLVEKIGDRIKLYPNINELYCKFFDIKKKYNYGFDDVFPLQKVRFENMFICIPNDIEKILETSYSKDLNNFKINNTYCPIPYIYTKITGIRNILITNKNIRNNY